MESDDDYQSFSPPDEPSSPVQHRRLKRLKKSRAPKKSPVKSVDDILSLTRVDFSELEALESAKVRGFDDSSEPLLSQSPSEGFEDDKELSSAFDDEELSSGFDELHVNDERKETEEVLEFNDAADEVPVRQERKETKRALEFNGIGDEFGGEGDIRSGGGEEGTLDLDTEKNEKKKRSIKDVSGEKKEKKKRLKSSTTDDVKFKTSSSNKRREENERRAHLQQLHAESQRLLRESTSAAFKPVPLVQKPISSVLEKIRRRKLEVARKFFPSKSVDLIAESNSDFTEVVTEQSENVFPKVGSVEKLVNLVEEEKVAWNEDVEPKLDGQNSSGKELSGDNVPSEMPLDEESTPAFRAPVDDTQDLFGDSQTSEDKDEMPSDQNNSPQDEVLAPSFLTMQLKFDSAPPDDILSDEEENYKENVDPHLCKLDDGCSSPKGDPVKAFVDDEAEEEDDSDNDISRFREDDDDEDSGDLEELKDMIVSGYKENPVDNEIRNELHQKWLEEKDASGTDDLLRRLKCGSQLREAGLLDEDEEYEDEESGSEAEEDAVQANVARISTKKAKQMIAQMFTDKDEAFLSSDDEETEKKLVRQRLLYKAEEQSTLLSPVEDESSREVFSLIKKLNIVSEPKKKAKSASFFVTMLTGGNSNSSSKSSFLRRVSNHSIPTSRKQGSGMVKSFVFGRDDSNSRSSISISEDSLETISKESQPTRKVTAKFSSSQTRSSSQTAMITTEAASGTSLFEILKRSSVQSTKVLNQENTLSQNVFAAFKIPKPTNKAKRKELIPVLRSH